MYVINGMIILFSNEMVGLSIGIEIHRILITVDRKAHFSSKNIGIVVLARVKNLYI